LSHYQLQNISLSCARGDAYADLVCSLIDRAGGHTVNAGRRQEKFADVTARSMRSVRRYGGDPGIRAFRFPLLLPVGAKPSRHDHFNQQDQPEPETKSSCLSRARQLPYS
jgi:hypothetical protein